MVPRHNGTLDDGTLAIKKNKMEFVKICYSSFRANFESSSIVHVYTV